MIALLLANHEFSHTIADLAEDLTGPAALIAAGFYWRTWWAMHRENNHTSVRVGVGIAAAVVSYLALFRMLITLDLMSTHSGRVFILPMTVVVYGVHVYMASQLLAESRARRLREDAERILISSVADTPAVKGLVEARTTDT